MAATHSRKGALTGIGIARSSGRRIERVLTNLLWAKSIRPGVPECQEELKEYSFSLIDDFPNYVLDLVSCLTLDRSEVNLKMP